MQEKKATIIGNTYDLPKPFHVLARKIQLIKKVLTLPEAQLDILNEHKNILSRTQC